MMNRSSIAVSECERKLRRITLIFILIGAAAAVCLVFFFIQLFSAGSSNTPKIFKAEQIGATDTSVLIAWSSSDAAKQFLIRYKSTDEKQYNEFLTDQPFAAIHDLAPYTEYDASIVPVDDSGEYEGYSLVCNTSPYCHVKSVSVADITAESARVTWNFDGINRGFTVIAYAVDESGKRHLTTEQLTVSPDSGSECTLSGLLAEVNYAVCVMPLTKYCTVGKSTFTTLPYSRSYNRFGIIRFVACPYDSDDSVRVRMETNLSSGQPYKVSMIFNGEAKQTENFRFDVYITDENGNVFKDFLLEKVPANPNNDPYYAYRTVLADITAPDKPGNYYIYAAIDKVTVIRIPVTVTL